MNQVQISHPALVALQGRLRSISGWAEEIYMRASPQPGLIRSNAEQAIAEIDQWLTDPAKQVTGGGDHG